MIDGEAVLYTYNFIFNTLENIGEYFGGGTVTRGETLLESDRGFYYADTKDVICIGNAELRDTAYQIMSDSMGFNMDTEIATFYTDTKIWNQKGEILSADRGWYYTKDEHYHFIENAYILTADQEVWADDINYWSLVEDAVLRNNIQIRDEEQELLSFGDYGIYFGESGDAMLTENPSLISFADENGDSLYMRSDTMFMYMIDTTSIYHPDYVGKKKADSGVVDEVLIDPANEMLNRQAQLSSLIDKAAQGGGITAADSVALGLASGGLVETMGPMPVTDSLAQGNIPPGAISANEVDSVSVDNIISGTVSDESLQAPIKEPTKKELRQQLKEAKRLAKEAKRKEKEAVKQAKAAAKRAKRGKPITSPDNAEEAGEEAAEEPGMGDNIVDPEEEMTEPETEEEEKEKDRVLIAYYNVKMWRTDFQAVCDSMLAFSIDTTMHMYIDPLMWNGVNQRTSYLSVIQCVNEHLD